MAMHQGMDLSRFKRVSSDSKTTTLRHVKGHEVKIAHSGLSPKMREHLANLPQHEEVQCFAEGGQAKKEKSAQPVQPVDPISPEQVQVEPAPAPQGAIPPKPAVMPSAGEVTVQAQRPPAIDPNQLRMQDELWQQDLSNGHITPETYQSLFAKKDTLGKIGTFFGLLVSGAGAGLTKQPNAVMEMMNKTIANDLDAQKQSKTNAQNFLELNRRQIMDLATMEKMQKEGVLNEAQAKAMMTDADLKAYTLGRMQANRSALSYLVNQTNKLPQGSPQRQAAEQQLALLFKGINNENFNLADQAAAAGALSSLAFSPGQSSGADPEASFQQGQTALRVGGQGELADDRESKHMPGLEGKASVPLTADDRNQIKSGVTFQKQLEDFIKWSKAHSGDLNPKDRAYGQALAAELQSAYRGAINGGVYKPSEQDFIGKIIDSTPTKFFNEIRVQPGLEAVKHTSQMQLDELVKSKGFKGYKGGGSKTGMPPEGTKGTYKGKSVVVKGGKWVQASK